MSGIRKRRFDRQNAVFSGASTNWLMNNPGLDASLGLSTLDAPKLRERVAYDGVSLVREQCKSASIHVYGTISVAVRGTTTRLMTNAFRFWYSDAFKKLRPVPFLRAIVRSDYEEGFTELSLFSESPIWLQRGHALNGNVGLDEADVNLQLLARLAAKVVSREPTPIRSVSLATDGSNVVTEIERLRLAFRDLLMDEAARRG